ncbi:amidohydrolase [Paenibacillus sp. GCM10023252]|uniref:amidohydrolase n=1 Tax=Paenibacillus sp. GCM10023252 TaxID=3252649 RepID=UPI0036136924
MLHIYNAAIYTANENNEVFEQGELLLDEGRILAIGSHLQIPAHAEKLDAKGGVITPGLIDAHTHVGMCTAPGDTSDINESSVPFTPLMRTVDGINPFDPAFEDARAAGVTTIQCGAGSTNPVAGVWAVLKTVGTIADDMIIRQDSGLKCALGENPKMTYGIRKGTGPFSRMSIAQLIRDAFAEGRKLLEQGTTTFEQLYPSGKHPYLPFIQVLQGQMPLRIHAHRADDIATALRLAKEFDIQLSVEHCTEGLRVTDALKNAGHPVTLGPFMGPSTKHETRNMNLSTPKQLHELGIPISIITDHPYTPIQHLSLCAAEAVKHGLDPLAALRAITIHPATLCGVADRVGSLEPGKDADLVLWSEHPFRTRARVLTTWINGSVVYKRE